MKKTLNISIISILASIASAVFAGERIGDFALIDNQGSQHHMAWYDDQNAIVILPQAVGATDTSALSALQELRESYADQGVVFFLMNPGIETDRKAVSEDIASLGAEFPVLMDDAQLATEALGITRLDQAVVYDPKSFELVYRGPVGAELETALKRTIDGSDDSLVVLETTGAEIEYTGAGTNQVPSYVSDVAPIIKENCANCHREGGIAPFAMDSKLALRGWSPMIREVVMTKRMPPGQIDNKVSHKMKNQMNLSDTEMQTLVRWVNAGSPVDGGEIDPLVGLEWPDTKWTLEEELGEPDLIVKIPPQAIPATGVLDYRNLGLDLGLTEDRWVRASEVAPDKTDVLHHIITTVIPAEGRPDPQQQFVQALNSLPEERAAAIRAEMFAALASGNPPPVRKILSENPGLAIGALQGGPDDIPQFGGYAPGNAVTLAPEGVGGLLKAGTSLSLQMHYTTSGREVTDETEIGIWFYPDNEVPEERMTGGVGNDFNIEVPAFSKDHEMEVVTFIKNESDLYSLMPHMHFRGKRMKFFAEYPDGSEVLLLSVPDYDFNWQLVHELADPIRLPAGTRIRAIGAFDNSEQNKANPDPSTDLSWGEQTFQEMFMGFYSWKELNQGGDD